MPWTLVHPAAVLPLLAARCARRWSALALVLGAMSPDFGYYVGAFGVATLAHSLVGVLAVGVPSALVIYLLIRRLRAPVTELLPSRLSVALDSLPQALPLNTVACLGRAAGAAALGALTHVVWDAFTHRSGWVVQQWPALQRQWHVAPGLDLYGYQSLQQLSNLVGGGALFGALAGWLRPFPRRWEAGDAQRCSALVGMLGLALGGAWLLFPPQQSVFHFVLATTSGLLVLLTVAALWNARTMAR